VLAQLASSWTVGSLLYGSDAAVRLVRTSHKRGSDTTITPLSSSASVHSRWRIVHSAHTTTTQGRPATGGIFSFGCSYRTNATEGTTKQRSLSSSTAILRSAISWRWDGSRSVDAVAELEQRVHCRGSRDSRDSHPDDTHRSAECRGRSRFSARWIVARAVRSTRPVRRRSQRTDAAGEGDITDPL